MKKLKRALFAMLHPLFLLRRMSVGALRASLIELNEITREKSEIHTILEAGASTGEDTQNMANFFYEAHIYAFEPVKKSYKVLREKFEGNPNVELINAALSSKSGDSTMYVSEDVTFAHGEGSSSLLEPTQHLNSFKTISFPANKREVVQTYLLSDWAESRNIRGFDLIWLDLQGLEVEVIRSSSEMIRNSRFLHLEATRKPQYLGACTFKELDKLVKSLGFSRKITRVGMVSGNVLYENRKIK